MAIKNSVAEVLENAVEWLAQGYSVDLVTVAKTFGSSPRPAGTLAVVRSDGLLVGSVSGGCIEKQLVETLRKVDNTSAVAYHISDAEAKRYGLMCGGDIELIFEKVTEHSMLAEALAELNLGHRIKRTVNIEDLHVTLAPATGHVSFSWDGKYLTQIMGPSHSVIIIGAGELSRFTAQFANAVDFDVHVIEPRAEFRSAWTQRAVCTPVDQMPDDAVKQLATHNQCAVLALSHDPNLDDLALMEALERQLFYVGALGSTRSHKKRLERLSGFDYTNEQMARIHGPIGLNIGSRTSAERSWWNIEQKLRGSATVRFSKALPFVGVVTCMYQIVASRLLP